MTWVDKQTSSYLNNFILYQEYAGYDHIYQVYARKSQTNENSGIRPVYTKALPV